MLFQENALYFGLYTFSDDFQSYIIGHTDDGLHNHRISGFYTNVMDE
jgi:hypothetical protein